MLNDVWSSVTYYWPELRLWLGNILCFAGAALAIIGAIGMLRFPDFYTRMHAASVIDTGAAGLLILGMMFLPSASLLIIFKLFLIALFIAMTTPTGSHAIANAAFIAGVKPIFSDGEATEADSRDVAGKSVEQRT